MIETVVGQSIDLSIGGDRPQIGALVRVLVSLMRVGFDYQRATIRAPRSRLHVHSKMRNLFWSAASARHHVKLLGRSRGRVSRIRQVAALIESIFHPIKNVP